MANWRIEDLDYVEGDEIKPSNMTKTAVEKYAVDLAAFAEFKVGQDPKDLVKLFGGRVHWQDYSAWEAEDGSIFVHKEADFDILLSRYTSPLRDRFTVAHELGHYFLHSNQGETPIVAHRSGSTRIEWEANWFAAALLMPKAKFKATCSTTNNLARIAAIYGVSEDAARVRRDAVCT